MAEYDASAMMRKNGSKGEGASIISVLALVLSLYLPPVGLVLGIIGAASAGNSQSRSVALAGIIISVVLITLLIIAFLLFGMFIFHCLVYISQHGGM